MGIALSTKDNPYSPVEDYAKWDAWDRASGYYTAAYLDRILTISLEFNEEYQDVVINDAIDEIIAENPLIPYYKVLV